MPTRSSPKRSLRNQCTCQALKPTSLAVPWKVFIKAGPLALPHRREEFPEDDKFSQGLPLSPLAWIAMLSPLGTMLPTHIIPYSLGWLDNWPELQLSHTHHFTSGWAVVSCLFHQIPTLPVLRARIQRLPRDCSSSSSDVCSEGDLGPVLMD